MTFELLADARTELDGAASLLTDVLGVGSARMHPYENKFHAGNGEDGKHYWLTRPDLYADYYLEQFRLLLKNHGTSLEVGTSAQPIPAHFCLADDDHVEGTLTPERRLRLRDLFDPRLARKR